MDFKKWNRVLSLLRKGFPSKNTGDCINQTLCNGHVIGKFRCKYTDRVVMVSSFNGRVKYVTHEYLCEHV